MTAHQREVQSLKVGPEGIAAMQGSNADWVKNRKAIRMANLSAAEKLKAELEGRVFEEPKEEDDVGTEVVQVGGEQEEVKVGGSEAMLGEQGEGDGADEDMEKPEVERADDEDEGAVAAALEDEDEPSAPTAVEAVDPASTSTRNGSKRSSKKRKAEAEDEDEGEKSDLEAPPDIESDQPISKKKLKINSDGTVDGYVDDVKLWEPGYRERYYEQKFGKSTSDTAFVDQ
jgi:5'-3' exoribonuclease 2